MLRLREHPLEDALEPPPPPEAPEPTDETPPPETPRSPVRRADGTPIGLRAYCELVTPAWNWTWAHLRALDDVLDKVIAGELTRVIIELPAAHRQDREGDGPAQRVRAGARPDDGHPRQWLQREVCETTLAKDPAHRVGPRAALERSQRGRRLGDRSGRRCARRRVRASASPGCRLG
jgi:hypothetical protein